MEYFIVIWLGQYDHSSAFIYETVAKDYFIDLELDPRELTTMNGTFFQVATCMNCVMIYIDGPISVTKCSTKFPNKRLKEEKKFTSFKYRKIDFYQIEIQI